MFKFIAIQQEKYQWCNTEKEFICVFVSDYEGSPMPDRRTLTDQLRCGQRKGDKLGTVSLERHDLIFTPELKYI